MSSDRVRNLIQKQKAISGGANLSDELKNLSDNISQIPSCPKTSFISSSNNDSEILSRLQTLEDNLRDVQPLIVMRSQIEEVLIKFVAINAINNDLDEIKKQINHISEELSNQTEKEVSAIINATNNTNDAYTIKRIKNDIDNLNKRISEFTQSNLLISDKLSKVECTNQDLLSILGILDSRTTQLEDQKLPSFQEEISNLRNKVDMIKKINEDSSNEFRRNIGSVNNTLNSYSDIINKVEKESDENFDSMKETIVQLKKRLDDLPFQQQLNNINNSLTSVLPTLKDLSKRVDLNDSDISDLQKSFGIMNGNFEKFKSSSSDETSRLSQKVIEMGKQNDKLQNDFNTSNKFLSDSIQGLIDSESKDKSSYDILNSDNENNKRNITNLSKQVSNNTTNIDSLITSFSKLDEQNSKLSGIVKSLNGNVSITITEQDTKINDMSRQLKDFLPVNDKIQQIVDKIESLNNNLISIINDSSRNNETIMEMISSLNKSNQSSSHRIDNLEKSSNQKNENIKELTDQNSQLSSKFNNLSSQISGLNIDSINSLISDLNKSNSENSSKITTLTNNQNNLTSSQTSLQNMFLELKLKIDNDTRIPDLIKDMKMIMDIIDSLKGGNNSATLKQLRQDTDSNKSAIEQIIPQIENNNKSITSIQDMLSKAQPASLALQELKNGVQILAENGKQMLSRSGDIEKAQSRNESQIKDLSTQIQKLSSDDESFNSRISALEHNPSFDNSTLITQLLSQTQKLTENDSLLQTRTSNLENDNQINKSMISQLNLSFESLNIENIKSLIQQLELIKDNMQIGESMPSNNDSMKWMPSYNLLTGERDSNVTSISDINDNAVLMIGNKLIALKGIKSIGKMESDTLSLGYGIPNKKGTNTLEVKGDVKFDGKLNGSEISDLGRAPKMTQTIEASVGSLVSIPYSGPAPNYIKVMLEGMYSVPMSKTDGYLYSFSSGKLNILCGSNSIGSEFNSSGRITDKTSGNYTIYIY